MGYIHDTAVFFPHFLADHVYIPFLYILYFVYIRTHIFTREGVVLRTHQFGEFMLILLCPIFGPFSGRSHQAPTNGTISGKISHIPILAYYTHI